MTRRNKHQRSRHKGEYNPSRARAYYFLIFLAICGIAALYAWVAHML